jgi:ribonuclease P protein component
MRFRVEQRLRRQRDFRDAREKGRRQDCGGFTLWYHRRPSLPEKAAAAGSPPPAPPLGARVGVVASTAAVGSAVQRNRAKRRLREVFRRNQHRVDPQYDLLLIARRSLNQLEYGEIEQKFVDACRRLFPSTP